MYKYFELNFNEANPTAPRYRVVFSGERCTRLHDVALVYSEARAEWLCDLLNNSQTCHKSEVIY